MSQNLQQQNQGLMAGWVGASNTTTTQYPYGFAQVSMPAPVEREHKIEVPIIEKGDRAGIFLKGEHGELIHIDSERLYKMAGVEW